MHQVNITVHTAQVAVDEVANCSFELLNHQLYSPDLASSDLFLFRKIKSCLRGQRFGNKNDIICDVEEFLEDQDANFFGDGITILKDSSELISWRTILKNSK